MEKRKSKAEFSSVCKSNFEMLLHPPWVCQEVRWCIEFVGGAYIN